MTMPQVRFTACGLVLGVVALLAGSSSSAGNAEPLPRLQTGDIYELAAAIRPAVVIVAGDGSWALGGADGTGKGHWRSPGYPGHITWLKWTHQEAVGFGAAWDTCLACRIAIQRGGRHVVIDATVPRGGEFTVVRIGGSCWQTGVGGDAWYTSVKCR